MPAPKRAGQSEPNIGQHVYTTIKVSISTFTKGATMLVHEAAVSDLALWSMCVLLSMGLLVFWCCLYSNKGVYEHSREQYRVELYLCCCAVAVLWSLLGALLGSGAFLLSVLALPFSVMSTVLNADVFDDPKLNRPWISTVVALVIGTVLFGCWGLAYGLATFVVCVLRVRFRRHSSNRKANGGGI
jgi:hypothetical protein